MIHPHRCSNCFVTKPPDAFYVKRWKGQELRQARCKACNAEKGHRLGVEITLEKMRENGEL